ncbi:hypothetical protein LTR78_006655 [Recurvomyces mirabilis]|uniref:Uncharacterized protein n=2 Tax=Recurvomyces mirabilis TaxID=574656 RepID=A0AAE0WKJ5_9PEZI|nr:hypothetical protein LTR78_006655 [Recurvomyces mirabilis]
MARTYFFHHFVAGDHFDFLLGYDINDFLLTPITACGLAAISNVTNDTSLRNTARKYYVDAITALNEVLKDPTLVREDRTLIAIMLLSLHEPLWLDSNHALHSWDQHMNGAVQVLQLRGQAQLHTEFGRMLFRELRKNILLNALFAEQRVPQFVVSWSETIAANESECLRDDLSLLTARLASVKASFADRSLRDDVLEAEAATIETDLLGWSERMRQADVQARPHQNPSTSSSHSTRQISTPPAESRSWNFWRCLRILLSRVQEAVYRRSWPHLTQVPPSPQHYREIRESMTTDICAGVAQRVGDDMSSEVRSGSVAAGLLSIWPLHIAGTCLLEELAESSTTPGGSRTLLLNRTLHLDPNSATSVQLAWVIRRLDHIGGNYGIQWAYLTRRLLAGERGVYYNLGRSRVITDEERDQAIFEEVLDLSALVESTSEAL